MIPKGSGPNGIISCISTNYCVNLWNLITTIVHKNESKYIVCYPERCVHHYLCCSYYRHSGQGSEMDGAPVVYDSLRRNKRLLDQ